jgi:hypothetical protein
MSERADKIFQKLEEAADKHIAGGGEIVFGVYARDDKRVCPIVALTGRQTGSYKVALEAVLGEQLDRTEFRAIISGVDGWEQGDYPQECPQDLFEVGSKLRAKYNKQQ